jgi:Tol biopolymer transport system component
LQLWDVQQSATTSVSTTADKAPIWSAQSDKLAFECPHGVGVYDVSAKTTVNNGLASPTIEQLAFAPDGAHLAYQTSRFGDIPATLSFTETSMEAPTSLGAASLLSFSPGGTRLAYAAVVAGQVSLHLRTIATGDDQTIASNAPVNGLVWSDDGAQAAYVTNAGGPNASGTLSLWTAASGTSRVLASGAATPVSSYVRFVAGGARLVYAAFVSRSGSPKTGPFPDLYAMDLATSTTVWLGEDLFAQYVGSAVAYLTAGANCAAFASGYDAASKQVNVTSFPLTGPLPAGGTMLERGSSVASPIVVSAKRVAYVIGRGVYASALPCAAP